MKLLVATNNPGKLREFRALLPGFDLVSPDQVDLALNVEETGDTFAENAALKANAFARASGLIALADDSGLVVDVLDGAPGVHSARFGGSGLDDTGRCNLLLEKLTPFPHPQQRNARFCCIIVAAAPDGRSCQAAGTCEGRIASAPAGDGGFGYDPVFFLPDLACTMAQIDAEAKNRISHRSRALEALRPSLLQTFPQLSPA